MGCFKERIVWSNKSTSSQPKWEFTNYHMPVNLSSKNTMLMPLLSCEISDMTGVFMRVSAYDGSVLFAVINVNEPSEPVILLSPPSRLTGLHLLSFLQPGCGA